MKLRTLIPFGFGVTALALIVGCGSVQKDLDSTRSTPSLKADRSTFANRTFVTYDAGHGTQVEYHTADGNSYLWYPGNTRSVPAKWEMKGVYICYTYPGHSYNPVTQEFGGQLSCGPVKDTANGVTAIVSGDPYGLSDGRPPFTLPSGSFSASELADKSGIAPSQLNILYGE